MILYLDTSALVKLHVEEVGTPEVIACVSRAARREKLAVAAL